jgi:hypothetical protein
VLPELRKVTLLLIEIMFVVEPPTILQNKELAQDWPFNAVVLLTLSKNKVQAAPVDVPAN